MTVAAPWPERSRAPPLRDSSQFCTIVNSPRRCRPIWTSAVPALAGAIAIAAPTGAQSTLEHPPATTARVDEVASELARAMASRDTAAVIGLMVDAASFTQSDRTTVNGASAVGRALLRTRFSDGVYRILFAPIESATCLTGAVQTGSYVVMRLHGADQESVERGTIALSWTPVGNGLHVDRLALVADGNGVAARQRLGARCSRLDARTFVGRRLELSVMPGSMAGWKGIDRLESALADRGWTRQPAVDLFRTAYQVGQSDALHDGRTDPGMIWIGGASVRLTPRLRVAASVQPNPSRARLVTYNETASSRLTQDVAVRETTLGLTADAWHLRVGFGAAAITSSVQERYEHLVLHDPASPTGAPGRGTIEDEHYSPSSIGAVASLQYSFAVTSRAALGIIGRDRMAPALQIKGVETHRDWTFDVDGSYVGLLATIAW